ncbi:hypothetical protein B0J15DRAFT_403738 [Fusarium solani]|uniref:Vegetative cell wall protein gp1 n=1 Tax=Fusarium solani TaxID=169388 RepID=A0A9P9GSF2_FUSSL|nr:uncharacterized protein B0J15DRAFT_403738 [Fusarium solani]KAH7243932.1 hypothetical protein B0J15DRAFT_403738 [Fusarium solani]
MSYPFPGTPRWSPILNHASVYPWMSSVTPSPSPYRAWAETIHHCPTTQPDFGRFNSSPQQGNFGPRPPKGSPRYSSFGQYSTAVINHRTSLSLRLSASSRRSKCNRQYSFAYIGASNLYGESDEDEFIEAPGHTYVLPAQSRLSNRHDRRPALYTQDFEYDLGLSANYDHNDGPEAAVPTAYYKKLYGREQMPVPQLQSPTSFVHSRRSSTAVLPTQSQLVRPTSCHCTTTPILATPKATEADARKHHIPQGYSLKNWDPTEEPVLLLGSVFDANSLGKWIYDWTIYHHGPSTPLSDMAGELWLLLIQLAGKVKRAEEFVGRARSAKSRVLAGEFIDAGDRLSEKLRGLLKACESSMLKVAERKTSGPGKNAGIEFVETLFGWDRQLDKTEKFMQNARLFILRFDANCEEIL